jgi:hypothetical protein
MKEESKLFGIRSFSEQLQRVFSPADRGVVGLVDDLLRLCQGQGLQFDWHANQCRIRPLGPEPREAAEIPLPKSVFRAILARMTVLCNERMPNSVSPYGGAGELSVDTNPPTVFQVAFTNTPREQRLEVRCGETAMNLVEDANGAAQRGTIARRSGRVTQ